MPVTVNMLLNRSTTNDGFGWLRGFLEFNYNNPPQRVEVQVLNPITTRYKCFLGDRVFIDLMVVAILSNCLQLNITQVELPGYSIEAYGQTLLVPPDLNIGSFLNKLRLKAFNNTGTYSTSDGGVDNIMLNWHFHSGVLYYETTNNSDGTITSSGKSILDLTSQDWVLSLNPELGRPAGSPVPYNEVYRLATSPLELPVPQNQPAQEMPDQAQKKNSGGFKSRKRNFERLWKAYLADEKIRNSPTKFNQASLYKWAGHNEASGLSKAIRDLRKMREEQPEEFQKLIEYGQNHPVQEVKDDSD